MPTKDEAPDDKRDNPVQETSEVAAHKPTKIAVDDKQLELLISHWEYVRESIRWIDIYSTKVLLIDMTIIALKELQKTWANAKKESVKVDDGFV